MHFAPRRQAGFTLVETLIALAVTGVLSSIAYPSVADHVQRARRSDAWVAALQVQMAEERWRLNASAYGSLAEIGVAAVSPGRHYTLQLAASSDGYRLVAQATGAQAADATCRVLQLELTGANTRHASGADATVANDADANRRCWGL